eukprot:10077067-Ditylum_brightwellii.AAC.1
MNLFSQCDSEGRQYQILDEIVDHKCDGAALRGEDGWFTTRSGTRRRKQTTRGWKLLVSWKDGSTDWVPLSELKHSNPVEIAEYCVGNQLQDEPAFAWWYKDVLRRRNRIISKVKSRYWKTTHKFGIELPHSVAEALKLDGKNGNDFWRRAIEKEMKKATPAFEKEEELSPDDVRNGKGLVGYQEIKCHMIFDIKMDGNFTRKARYVAGGHMTDPPSSITYSSVVSRES